MADPAGVAPTTSTVEKFIKAAEDDLATAPERWAVPSSMPPRNGKGISKPEAMEAYLRRALDLLRESYGSGECDRG